MTWLDRIKIKPHTWWQRALVIASWLVFVGLIIYGVTKYPSNLEFSYSSVVTNLNDNYTVISEEEITCAPYQMEFLASNLADKRRKLGKLPSNRYGPRMNCINPKDGVGHQILPEDLLESWMQFCQRHKVCEDVASQSVKAELEDAGVLAYYSNGIVYFNQPIFDEGSQESERMIIFENIFAKAVDAHVFDNLKIKVPVITRWDNVMELFIWFALGLLIIPCVAFVFCRYVIYTTLIYIFEGNI